MNTFACCILFSSVRQCSFALFTYSSFKAGVKYAHPRTIVMASYYAKLDQPDNARIGFSNERLVFKKMVKN